MIIKPLVLVMSQLFQYKKDKVVQTANRHHLLLMQRLLLRTYAPKLFALQPKYSP